MRRTNTSGVKCDQCHGTMSCWKTCGDSRKEDRRRDGSVGVTSTLNSLAEAHGGVVGAGARGGALLWICYCFGLLILSACMKE